MRMAVIPPVVAKEKRPSSSYKERKLSAHRTVRGRGRVARLRRA